MVRRSQRRTRAARDDHSSACESAAVTAAAADSDGGGTAGGTGTTTATALATTTTPCNKRARRSEPSESTVPPSTPIVADDSVSCLLQVADQTIAARPMKIFSASSPFTAADIATWRAALSADGYLHLRDLLPRATVIAARHRVTDELERRGLIHPQPRPLADGMPSGSEAYHSALAVDPSASPNLLSDVSLHRDPVIVSVLEHARLVDLFELLLVSCSPTDAPTSPSSAQSIQVWTSEFKWLRAVPRGQCTGFHLDKVYMKGSTPLYSLWLPLGDVTSSDGTLVVSPGSHRNDQFASLRAEYGESSVGAAGNGTTSGWIDVAAHTTTSVEWHSSPCYAGSVVILDLSVLHGTTINRSDSYRLSCDTRWTCTTHTRSDEALSPLASTPTPRASIRFKPLP